jgi:ABC-type multidrug transport system fused ATPase/permease subunit
MLQAAMIVGSMLLVRHAFDVLLNPAFDDPEVNLFDPSEVISIGLFALALLAFTGLAAWLRLLERVDGERLGEGYIHRVRLTLFDEMGKFAPRALSRRTTGATALRFVSDLTAIRRWVSLGLARIVVAAIVSTLALGFLAFLDPYLAAVSVLILSLGLAGNLLLGPRMNRAVSESRRLRGRLAGNINERIQAFAVIQVFNQQRRERKRYGRHSRQLRDAMVQRAKAAGLMGAVSDGSTAASMGLVLSLGAFEVFLGMTSAGNVVAAMAVVGFLASTFRSLGRVHEYYQSAEVSKRKLLEFLRTRRLKGRGLNLPPLQVREGRLEFQDITLNGILQGFSATAPGGCRIALLGANGAGKSTLLHVAARLVDPDAGQVLIDGQNLAECDLGSVRAAIAVISSDLPLLRGSIGYNLRYRWPCAPEEEVARIKQLCALDEMLAEFPDGEEHKLDEAGKNLSLGQRHRLALARALVGHPAVLIVDEIDANLDTHVGGILDRVIESFPGTVLMVTRSPQRLARADYLWRLQDGRLAAMEQPSKSSASGPSLPPGQESSLEAPLH